jgi:hypothetical protein
MGFRPPISTIDNTFIIRQLFLKSYEHNRDLHIILAGYTQDCEAVYKNKITEYPVPYKVQTKLIRPIELILMNTRATVTIKNEHTEKYKVTWNKTRKLCICSFI